MFQPAWILVVEEEDQIGSVLELAVEGLNLKVKWENSFQKAKRTLLADTPQLIVCKVVLGDDGDAGFRFAAELQAHPALKTIPVLLVTESVQDQILRKASESGARGLIPWPLKVDLLRQRLMALLPEASASVTQPTSESLSSQAAETLPPSLSAPVATTEVNQTVESVDAKDARLELVRKMLAAIFLRLQQTEGFYSIPEKELPKLILKTIYDLFRSDIGPSQKPASPPEPARAVEPVPAAPKQKPSEELDFDAIFGKKN